MKSIVLCFFLGVIGLISVAQAAEDYCSKTLCGAGEKHIACEHPGTFGKNCPEERKLITIDEPMKKLIVDLHNELRDKTASGELEGYKPAKRMASMTWDNELAYLAGLQAMGCEMEHDECHATKTYKLSGQNLGQSWYMGEPKPTIADTFTDLIKSWHSEHEFANMDIIRNYPSNWDEPDDIGHFTVLVNDFNTKVGCGSVWMIDEDKYDSVLLTCNYAVTNLVNNPVYEEGPPASGCKTGKHPDYKNLCSSKEVF
ncbi:antigen 5 like allergen Cul n 1-like [Eupeodes corollae]|uniref:antigen 5 like allergen Cul n 1-like n=1 Tax=Eupeodes corollae TaxID=290404 RepID=UPI0024924643|nr:antigen 5 like allergen Cul n 1-like [Eupeodes corollae]